MILYINVSAFSYHKKENSYDLILQPHNVNYFSVCLKVVNVVYVILLPCGTLFISGYDGTFKIK